jgi:hypothetical protein
LLLHIAGGLSDAANVGGSLVDKDIARHLGARRHGSVCKSIEKHSLARTRGTHDSDQLAYNQLCTKDHLVTLTCPCNAIDPSEKDLLRPAASRRYGSGDVAPFEAGNSVVVQSGNIHDGPRLEVGGDRCHVV